MDITRIAPEVDKHLLGMGKEIEKHVDPKLHHLLKLRASQINSCALCLAMHTDEALRDGESPERLMLLDTWSESSTFTDQERAALSWIEELALIADSGASSEAFDGLKPHSSEDELGWLTLGRSGYQCVEPDRDLEPRSVRSKAVRSALTGNEDSRASLVANSRTCSQNHY